jgi:hypothetical protein
MPLSNRIFDIGDISKDLWGSMIGLFFVFFILNNGDILSKESKIREKHIVEYHQNPLSLIVFVFIFSLVFMNVASLLTEVKYTFIVVRTTIIIFGTILLILHFSQFKFPRIVTITVLAISLTWLSYNVISHRDKSIEYISDNIISYKGLPLFYFDVMIYPNGNFRFVDKKITFNQRDQLTIFDHTDNILIVASGNKGQGGKGFPQDEVTQFVYNRNCKKAQQVIILNNKEAIEKYKQLLNENKTPLLIYHNN